MTLAGGQAGAVALSLGAAVLYAATSALQQSAAATVPHERSLRPGLLLDLLRRPRWLLGTAAEVGAVGLQFLALRQGSLLLVQVLLVSGLLFALPLGAALTHRRLRPREWLGAVAVVAGLAAFVTVAAPSAGYGNASGPAWTVVLGGGGGVVAFLLLTAPRRPGARRATWLGAAFGVQSGVNAALAKASGHLLDRGVVHALAAWQPYALVALGLFGLLLAQSAFQAGPLGASLPMLTVADPVASALIAALAFHERLASGAVDLAVELAAVAAMVAGVFVLARSPLVTHEPAG